MAAKSREPLEREGREIRFFQGDWEQLTHILSPFKIAPSTFIRELVRKHIRQIESRVSAQAQPVETLHVNIDTSDLIREPTDSGQS